MKDDDLIVASLELAAEKAGDISAAVYKHYFAASPQSEHLMDHMDHLMRARMLDEAIMLIMKDDDNDLQTLIHFEVMTHTYNGVLPEMYTALFHAIQKTVREAVAEAWNSDFEGAWQRRINALAHEFDRHFALVVSDLPQPASTSRR